MEFENFCGVCVIFFQVSILFRKTSTCLHHRHPRMGRREPRPGWWTQPGWRRCSPRGRCAWRTRTGRGCLGSNKNRGKNGQYMPPSTQEPCWAGSVGNVTVTGHRNVSKETVTYFRKCIVSPDSKGIFFLVRFAYFKSVSKGDSTVNPLNLDHADWGKHLIVPQPHSPEYWWYG